MCGHCLMVVENLSCESVDPSTCSYIQQFFVMALLMACMELAKTLLDSLIARHISFLNRASSYVSLSSKLSLSRAERLRSKFLRLLSISFGIGLNRFLFGVLVLGLSWLALEHPQSQTPQNYQAPLHQKQHLQHHCQQ